MAAPKTRTKTPPPAPKRTKEDELFGILNVAEHVARGLHVLWAFALLEDADPRVKALMESIAALQAQAELLEGEALKAWNAEQEMPSRPTPSTVQH